VYVRVSRRTAKDILEHIYRILQQQTPAASPIDVVSLGCCIAADSTIVKAHPPDGRGALKKRRAGDRRE
jgi:hypothetical protein